MRFRTTPAHLIRLLWGGTRAIPGPPTTSPGNAMLQSRGLPHLQYGAQVGQCCTLHVLWIVDPVLSSDNPADDLSDCNHLSAVSHAIHPALCT